MFKHEKDKIRYLYLHPAILLVLFDMKFYCYQEGMRFNVTSTVTTLEEDNKVHRKSSTHRTGRAFDLSLRGWSELEIKDFINYFNEKYKHIAAYSQLSGRNNLIIRHNSGYGDHLHVQINAKFKLPELSEFTSKDFRQF